jgi:DNA-binding response OmpR family regulator
MVERGAMKVTLDGEPVRFTVREFELLWFLITTRPRVASRERILDRVWGITSDVETRTIDVHIRSLRAKLGSEVVETVIGAGYRFRGFE